MKLITAVFIFFCVVGLSTLFWLSLYKVPMTPLNCMVVFALQFAVVGTFILCLPFER